MEEKMDPVQGESLTKEQKEKLRFRLACYIRMNRAVRKQKRIFPYVFGALPSIAEAVRKTVADAESRFPWYCPNHGILFGALPVRHGKGMDGWGWSCPACKQAVVRIQIGG
jgi:hypothetical protein